VSRSRGKEASYLPFKSMRTKKNKNVTTINDPIINAVILTPL
jgi:hypothetical protein